MTWRTRTLLGTAIGALLLAGCAGADTPADRAVDDDAVESDTTDGDPDSDPADSDAANGDLASVTELAVLGTDQLTFDPDTLTIPAGEPITLAFTSEAGVEHDLVIADAAGVGHVADDDDAMHAHGDEHGQAMEHDLHVAHADPGETVTTAFTIDEPGTYEVYCSVPGHRAAGMVASLTVTDAA